MTFNSNYAAFSMVANIASPMCCFYTNEGVEVVPTQSEMNNFDAVLEALKAAGFSNIKVSGKKFKKIAVNFTAMETVRTSITSIEY